MPRLLSLILYNAGPGVFNLHLTMNIWSRERLENLELSPHAVIFSTFTVRIVLIYTSYLEWSKYTSYSSSTWLSQIRMADHETTCKLR